MKKLFLATLISVALLLSLTVSNTYAASKPVLPDNQNEYSDVIVVDDHGGIFDIGFVQVLFKPHFLDENELPLTLTVEVYAENGNVYIEFTPSVDTFDKDVTIHVHQFEGFLVDRATGEPIYVEIPNQVFHVEHFSRYCFNW